MFRTAKLGPLIGERTWGGVVGITDHGQLIDGGAVNVPEFAYATPKASGRWKATAWIPTSWWKTTRSPSSKATIRNWSGSGGIAEGAGEIQPQAAGARALSGQS
jgi:hypothetical protein